MKNVLFVGCALFATAGLYGAATITVTQIGDHVYVVGSGTLNVGPSSGLQYDPDHSSWDDGAVQGSSLLFVGPSDTQLEAFEGISGPATFGNATYTAATNGTGDLFGILTYGANSPQYLMVPWGYDGEELSSSSIYENQSLTSLGLNEGTYVWAWGIGQNADSLTVIISHQIPEPTTYAALFSIATVGMVLYRRQKKKV